MRNFTRIATGVNVTPLMLAIARRPELWKEDTYLRDYPQGPFGQIDSIMLRFPEKRVFEQETAKDPRVGTPPGSVNTSNTASVLIQALTEAGVTGSMTGLPVPVLSAMRMLSIQVKNRRIQKRVEDALRDARSNPSQSVPAATPTAIMRPPSTIQ